MKTFQEYYSENFAPSERDARNELDAAAAGHANRERASGAMKDEIEGMKKVELERALRELIQAATEAEHDVDSSTKQSPTKITAETKNDLLAKIAAVAQRLEDDSRPIADDLVGKAGKATTGLNRSLRNSQVLDVASVDTNHLTPLIEALEDVVTLLERPRVPVPTSAPTHDDVAANDRRLDDEEEELLFKHDRSSGKYPSKRGLDKFDNRPDVKNRNSRRLNNWAAKNSGFLTPRQHHKKQDELERKKKAAVQSAFSRPQMKKKKPAGDSKALAKK